MKVKNVSMTRLQIYVYKGGLGVNFTPVPNVREHIENYGVAFNGYKMSIECGDQRGYKTDVHYISIWDSYTLEESWTG